MKILNHRVAGARWVAARASGGPMKPELIILHDTAGRLEKFNSVGWFASAQCKTSAHFVVERDGTVTQMVAMNRKAFHAGESTWGGRRFCNGFSIGIEIVNPGKMDKDGRAWFGLVTPERDSLQKRRTKEHGDGYWMTYSAEQIAAVKSLCRAICEEYPGVNEIVGHWQVSPGRKIDPNPLLPWDEIRAFALGDEPAFEAPDPQSAAPRSEDPAAWPTTTAKDLLPVSRHVQTGETAAKNGQALTISGMAGLFASWLGILQPLKEGFNGLKDVLSDPVFVVVCGAGLLLWRFGGRITALTVGAAREGRYVASGAVEGE